MSLTLIRCVQEEIQKTLVLIITSVEIELARFFAMSYGPVGQRVIGHSWSARDGKGWAGIEERAFGRKSAGRWKTLLAVGL